MKKGKELILRLGLEAWLSAHPRAGRDGFGLRSEVDAFIKKIGEGGAVIELRLPGAGPMDLEAPLAQVDMTWEDFEYHVYLRGNCNDQHGSEVAAKFFW